MTQLVQVRAAGGLYPKCLTDDPSRRLPVAFRLFRYVPPLRRLIGRFIGLGFRPEHVWPPESIAARQLVELQRASKELR